MVQVYNFLASWQLFPEKCTYEKGDRPKSGTYKITSVDEKRDLLVTRNWVALDNTAFTSTLTVTADGLLNDSTGPAPGEQVKVTFTDSISFDIEFFRNGNTVLKVNHEILPNGYLKLTEHNTGDEPYTNTEIYHKQLSVLPYAASVSGALVRPTEEGVIKHKALTAMEEQTNMQLNQIRQQIELLALQAQEIHKRKELSMMIYNARLSFKPNIGQTYFMYEKNDGNHMLSLVSPKEWGAGMPFKKFIAAVKLLADHTWMEIA